MTTRPQRRSQRASSIYNHCHPVVPDEFNRISLEQVIRCFNAPISEEQAWAIIHETIRTLSLLIKAQKTLWLVTHAGGILIQKDGTVADDTFLLSSSKSGRKPRGRVLSENKAVSELGVTIYEALDQGLTDDQERLLSPELEGILDLMVHSVSNDQDDEGIEVTDNEDAFDLIKLSGSCQKVLDVCRSRLAVGNESKTHFKAVCHALVSEAFELSTFIDKVSKHEADNGEELNEIGLQEWARIWVQVMKDMRNGIKLKQINFTKTPVEYELTPYEILMDDIRSRKYKLNKVMVNGELPSNVKKDAHDMILEFIRSRPPLKPASQRELKPKRKESTPVELLMASIRGNDARKSLRKTKGPELKSLRARLGYESSRCGANEFGKEAENEDALRRKVTLDTNLMENLLNFSEDEEEDDAKGRGLSRQASRESNGGDDPTPPEVHRENDYNRSSFQRHRRRHSLTVCETPRAMKATKDTVDADEEKEDQLIEESLRHKAYYAKKSSLRRPVQKVIYTSQFSTTSTAASRSRSPSPSSESSSAASSRNSSPGPMRKISSNSTSSSKPYRLNSSQMHANLHSEFIQSEHWATALQTLDLTLEEVVHIRSVLTKAEMESLPLDGNLKQEVAKGKICFLCMKSRFGFFNRARNCQLCKQQVCGKCSMKMKIPLQHFSTTPVFTLEPPLIRSGDELDSGDDVKKSGTFREKISEIPSFFKSSVAQDENHSSPSSPKSQPKKSAPSCSSNLTTAQMMTSSLTTIPTTEDEYDDVTVASGSSVTNLMSGPDSIDGTRTIDRNFNARGRKKSLEASVMTICTDCKEMVLQVIRAQSTARRLQMAKSLFMELDQTHPTNV